MVDDADGSYEVRQPMGATAPRACTECGRHLGDDEMDETSWHTCADMLPDAWAWNNGLNGGEGGFLVWGTAGDVVVHEWVRKDDPRAETRPPEAWSINDELGDEGEVHELMKLWPKEVWAHRPCPHCQVIATWLTKVCGGWLYGGVLEDFGEHWVENEVCRSHALGRMFIYSQRRWKRRPGSDELIAVEELEALSAKSLAKAGVK
jgi:hypothetical protein